MPDINNKPLRIGASVTVVCPNPLLDSYVYNGMHGEIVALHPGVNGAQAEIKFDDRTRSNCLFEGYELLVDEPKKKRRLLEDL